MSSQAKGCWLLLAGAIGSVSLPIAAFSLCCPCETEIVVGPTGPGGAVPYDPYVTVVDGQPWVAYCVDLWDRRQILLSRRLPESLFSETVLAEYSPNYHLFRPICGRVDAGVVVFWNSRDFDSNLAVVERALIDPLSGLASRATWAVENRVIADLVRVGNSLVAVFVNATSTRGYAWSATSEDGGETWSVETQVGIDEWGGGAASPPRLATNGSDIFCVLTLDWPRVACYRSSDVGASWELVSYFAADNVGYNAVRVACRGNEIVVGGSEHSAGPVYLAHSSNRGLSWTLKGSVSPPGVLDFLCPELWIDSTAGWHVLAAAFRSSHRSDLVHIMSGDRGGSWSEPDTMNCEPSSALVRLRGDDYRVAWDDDEPRAAWIYERGSFQRIHLSSFGPLADRNHPLSVVVTPGMNPTPRSMSLEVKVVLSQSAFLRCRIFSALGREVFGWVTGEVGPGELTLNWDGRDHKGERVASGVYFWRIEGGGALNGGTVRTVLY